jgi:peptidoglycan lytic transglycosylase
MYHLPPVDFDKSMGFRFTLAFTGLFAFMLAGCSSQNFAPSPPTARSYYAPTPENYRGTRTEVASWYGPGFEGHRTSSGEVFHSNELTAASTRLPLGSRALVTNPDNGRSVVVRINDRGPFVRGRSIDLSHRAAQRIGLTGKGVGRVRVTPTARSTASETPRTAVYSYSSLVPDARYFHYVSNESRNSHTVHRRTRYHYRHYSSRRIVSNPIGAWLASAFPRL